jgi:hypothetical protein
LIGTGFFRFGEVNHDDCITLRSLGYDLADNQIDTLTKAFLATTVACARCHNHKLDAISTDDYYAMLGVLRSSRNVSHCIDSPEVNQAQKKRMREIKSELRRELALIWRNDAVEFSRYMQAAHATRGKRPEAAELSAGLDARKLEKWVAALLLEKQPIEEPFEVWRQLSAADTPATPEVNPETKVRSTSEVWQALVQQFTKEEIERTEFNQTKFVPFADFRQYRPQDGQTLQDLGVTSDWKSGGQAMTEGASFSGDFVVSLEADTIVQAILPTGRFTHSLSSKLNGTLRSPVIPAGKKYLSVQVLGQRSSAVRLVSNHRPTIGKA